MSAQMEVTLTVALADAFETALAERRALLEASEIIARQFTEKLEANNKRITAAYAKAAAKHGLDLATCAYEYDASTKSLYLTGQRYGRS